MRLRAFVLSALLTLAGAVRAQDVCAIPNQPVAVTRCDVASIYVADFDRSAIEQILSKNLDGFTILPARGCWHKVCENSIVVQIAGASERVLRRVAEELRVAGKQESVLVVIPGRPTPVRRSPRRAR